MKKITFMLFAFLSITIGFAQTETLAEWVFTGSSNYGLSPFVASTTADNLVVGGLTRGSGIETTGTAAGDTWGGNGFTSTDAASAISENEFVTFTITADTGYTFSIEGIEPYNIRRSNAGPTTGQWQYQIGSDDFVDIGTPITWGGTTSNAGNNQDAIDLSDIPELQNIDENTTVTFRILLWGATGTGGTWYFNGHNNATNKTLTVLGTVEEESGSTPPPACDINVTLTFPEYGDVTEWRLLDANGVAVLTGGPYWDDYDFSITATHIAVNPPYTLEITTDDWWWGFCDNEVNYSVIVGGVQDISGTFLVCEDTVTQLFPLITDLTSCIPNCPAPTDVTATDITSDSAILSWTGTGDSFDIVWGPSGFNPETGGTLVTNATSPYTLAGLSFGTNYAFYVRQNCGTDISAWGGTNFIVGASFGDYEGDIPTQHNDNPTVTSTDFCTPEPTITIEVPAGYEISGLMVSYAMTAHNGAWQSEQYSFIYSPTLGQGETTLATNSVDEVGVQYYSRYLNFANGAIGTVDFVLRTWRTWSDMNEDCNTDYNYVNNGTWFIVPSFTEIVTDPCDGVVIPTTITASATEICEGTSVELGAATGTGYTYSWSDGTTEVGTTVSITVTPTTTTTYTVTVTNSDGCSASEDVVITVTAPVTPIFTPFPSICQGGIITPNAFPTTSNNGITGTWSPAPNNQETTTYTFTPDAEQCAETTTLTITVTPLVVPVFMQVAPIICAGDDLEPLPMVSNQGITGTWSPALDNTQTTAYTFTPDAGQCAASVTMIIVVNVAATPTVESPQTLSEGQTVADIVVTGVTGTLNWYDENGNVVDASTVLTEGTYMFEVTQTIDGCESYSTDVIVEVTLSTDTFDNASFRAYPNPVKDFFNVSYSKEISTISVINMLGQTVITKNVNATDVQIDMTTLPTGSYFVKVTADGAVKTVKVIR